MEQTKKAGLRHKLFGDKAFYVMVLGIAVPIMIQNGITNFVNLLDNIMIGRVGTEQMSGVAIVNQLLMVYSLCIFGGVSGAGIFTAQYFGQNNEEGVRYTVRFKLWMVFLITMGTIALFLTSGQNLIGMYLQGEGGAESIAAAMDYGKQYLNVMLIGLPPFMISQVYSSTLRESGQTVVPMRAGIAAVVVNLVFNYILIYGKFGAPAMGVRGAAWATVISRFVEVAIIVYWTHSHAAENPYVVGLYHSMRIPLPLVWKMLVTGMPLLVNETLWSSGMAMLAQCYSYRGFVVVAALNIANTIGNLFNIVFIAMGESVAIIVGQLLGAGKFEEARDTDTKMIVFSVLLCIGVAVMMILSAPLFPRLYNTTEEARSLARLLIIATAVFVPQNALLNTLYFTLRSGGKTWIAFLFDGVFLWCVNVMVAFCLSRFTAMPIMGIFIAVQFSDTIKTIFGLVLVKKGAWIHNIVS